MEVLPHRQKSSPKTAFKDLLQQLQNHSVVTKKSKYHVDDIQGEQLSQALKNNRSLVVELNLSDSGLGDDGLACIAEALRGNESLVQLILCGSDSITPAGIVILGECITHNRALTNLNLDFVAVEDSGAHALASALKVNTCLNCLSLSNSDITDIGARSLSSALEVNSTLTHLNLEYNEICCTGMCCIGDALAKNTSLGYLNVGYNNVGNEGAKSLASALIVNSSLLQVNLSVNRVGTVGMQALAQSLTRNSSLLSLGLAFNCKIDDFNAAKSIADAVDKNKTLLELDLYATHFPGELLNRVAMRLLKNKAKKKASFIKTLNGEKKNVWNRSRLMIVGQGRAGKSATVRSLLGLTFNPVWDSTVGAAVAESEIQSTNSSWRHLRTHLDDHSSPFAARIMRKTYSRTKTESHRTMASIVSDTSKAVPSLLPRMNANWDLRGSLKNTRESVSLSSSNYSAISASQNGIMARNTLAIHSSTSISFSKGTIAREFDDDLLYAATRDVNSNPFSLSLWDFGGQSVFYSIHHMFLTRSGVYVVVFDMRDMLNDETVEKCIGFIRFWIESIDLHAPDSRILIVGSFLDQVNGLTELRSINETFKSRSKFNLSKVIRNDANQLVFFPVDNKNKKGVTDLRVNVVQAIQKDETIQQLVSIKWIRFLDEILAVKSTHSFLELPRVKDIARSLGIMSSEEQEEALQLFHQRGLLVHLSKSQILKEIIVVHPPWLIDRLSKLVRDDEVHSFNTDEILKMGLGEDLELLLSKALVSRDLLDFLWKGERVEFLIEFMKHTMLLSSWPFNQQKLYLVPSLLKDAPNPSKNDKSARCIFDFSETFLPIGVFHRLLCLCVARCASLANSEESTDYEEPLLFKTYGSVEIEPNLKVILQEDAANHRITIIPYSFAFASRSFTIVHSMLKKINADLMNSGLYWNMFFGDTDGKCFEYSEAKSRKLMPWFHKDSKGGNVVAPDLRDFLDKI
mmetsp:Transcript_3937/g.4537  ORF Transcript_3937/g.4537 Transcript_3937/m.4537 type:complete len:971 (-) Transcript_3937:1477-4389(-)